MSDVIFDQIKAILLRVWDPIGIETTSELDDEYDGYARELARRLRDGTGVEEVLSYLKWASTENMGLSVFQAERAEKAAQAIADIAR